MPAGSSRWGRRRACCAGRAPLYRALIRAVPDLEGRLVLQGIPGQAPDPGRRPCRLLLRPALSFGRGGVPTGPAAPCRGRAGTSPALHPIRRRESVAASPVAASPAPASMAEGAPAAPVLRLETLKAFHGPIEILHGISLDLPARRCLALVGEVRLRQDDARPLHCRPASRACRQHPLSGGGSSAAARQRPAAARRHIQYIFQNPYASLNPRRRIGKSIAVALSEFESLGRGETRAPGARGAGSGRAAGEHRPSAIPISSPAASASAPPSPALSSPSLSS